SSSILDTISLSSANDRWSCDVNGDGMFRVKDIRSSLDDIFLPSLALATRWVKYIPIKINIFIWRARLDRLPTRSNLARFSSLSNLWFGSRGCFPFLIPMWIVCGISYIITLGRFLDLASF
ncbi:hypothetical protein Tco_0301765, partial [Tanacetum coccineum]